MKTDVLFIIKTCGLEYDDRVRKECQSLIHLKKNVLIAVLNDTNKAGNGTTSYDVPFKSFHLRSRHLFPQAKGLFVKTLEIYCYSFIQILRTKPDCVWLHNIEMFGLVPLAWFLKKIRFVKRLVWDQHELPPDFVFRKPQLVYVLSLLYAMCDAIVAASRERKEFLLERMKRDFDSRIFILQNFPDQQFSELPVRELPNSVKYWLNQSQYLLAQGGANPDRHLEQLVEAILRVRKVKLVVVGPYKETLKKRFEEKFNGVFDQYVHFTGFCPQMELNRFIDHALASIILYRTDDNNNRLCASNRLYQSIIRGTPMIVGCNPPMANLVKGTGFGVALQGDGSDVDDIVSGIHRFLSTDRRPPGMSDKENFLWERQEGMVSAITGE